MEAPSRFDSWGPDEMNESLKALLDKLHLAAATGTTVTISAIEAATCQAAIVATLMAPEVSPIPPQRQSELAKALSRLPRRKPTRG